MIRRRNFDPARIGIYFLLILFALLFLIPVYVLLVSSLKSFIEVQDQSKLWNWPSALHWESFISAWSGIPEKGLRGLSGNLFVSLALTIPAALVSALLGSLNGYVLSKWSFPGANMVSHLCFLYVHSLSEHSHPNDPNPGLHWPGRTLWGLVLVHIVYGLPITTLIFRNYYAEVPRTWLRRRRWMGQIFWIFTGGSYFLFRFPVLS